MKLRELLWICLFLISAAAAVKATFYPPPCPILTDLNPHVKEYIDHKMPADAYPSSESFEKLRGQIAALEARIPEVQKLATEAAALDEKQKKAETLLAEIREVTQKSIAESRTTELQWMKANVAEKCLGLKLQTATGSSISPPPLPEDLFKSAPAPQPASPNAPPAKKQ
ncbi:MAG: hypothetical protein KF799_00755 [Bdellovibrionales bacterium]|nr:hypothetical protein [Bdellovibrionales bacterium]